MRIIAGKYKGKKIFAPKTLPVRPTTDFAKEGLFNILKNQINFEQIKILDLFAGTGNISFEFSSRGCKNVTSIDLNFNCVKFMKSMNKELLFQNNIIRTDAFRYLKKCKESFNLIFADPPYDMENINLIPKLIFERNLLFEKGFLVLEHDNKIDFKNHRNFKEKRMYGKVNFSLFVK